ncbi:MAG TPA: rhomboid family intramembrane serine protease [Kofleriaceae bacterium]
MKLRITYNAPVVLTFTIAAVVVFLVNQAIPSTSVWFHAYPYLRGAPTYVGLVGHILGHESWEHLLGNFMLILLIGPILEERHGSIRLLLMILVTALVTGLINLSLSSTILLGASGIAFMMILLASMANVRGGEIPLTFIAVAIIYLGGEIVKSFNHDQVSHMAHLVGGAVGAAFGFLAAGRRGTAASKVKAKAPVDLAKLKI